jgi:ABC-type lipoprotein release transport system permease subunit
VGKSLEHANNKGREDLLIVGVVGDSKHVDMRTGVHDTLYRAAYQYPQPGFLQFYVRTWQSPEAAKPMIGEAMRQIDPNLVVDSLRTMDEQIAQSLANERLVALLAVSFGGLATLMAAIGLYGILAYSTAQRTREIGIRMALGARRSSVVSMVLSDVLRLAGVSIVVTLPLAFALSRLLRSQLYNVSPADPRVIAGGVLMVACVVLLAALLPARRAARVEPMQALRTE